MFQYHKWLSTWVILHESSPICYIWINLLIYRYRHERGLFRSTKLLWLISTSKSLGARSVTLSGNMGPRFLIKKNSWLIWNCKHCWQDHMWQYNLLLIFTLYFRLRIWQTYCSKRTDLEHRSAIPCLCLNWNTNYENVSADIFVLQSMYMRNSHTCIHTWHIVIRIFAFRAWWSVLLILACRK